ncbi:hypothetical protein [Cupriavidus necator]|uniref:hypothetical protein n=1 Tax=Cupriavidus necator TaxID=106590 RepID=UPI0005B349CC|nr:hypothetical protein [Cupriavidus necator]
MSEVVEAKRSGNTTAEDTLKLKSREAGIVSGGHLVTRALKNEGIDTIFTLCGVDPSEYAPGTKNQTMYK